MSSRRLQAIINLGRAGSWDAVREEINKTDQQDLKQWEIGVCLKKFTAHNGQRQANDVCPDGIIKTLLHKLVPQRDTYPPFWEHLFPTTVAEIIFSNQNYGIVDCGHLTAYKASHLRLLLKKYIQVRGRVGESFTRRNIYCLWHTFPWSRTDNRYDIQSLDSLRAIKQASKGMPLHKNLHNLWQKTIDVIKVYECQDGSFNKSLEELYLFHHFIRAGLPRIAIRMLLRILPPSQLQQQDHLGMTPLHWAAKYTEKDIRQFAGLHGTPPVASTILEMILNANPEAAKLPSKSGKLPLSILIKNASWSRYDFPHQSMMVFKLVAKGAPLNVRNKKNKLLPFMEAAAKNNLCLTYFILQLDPTVIQVACGLPRTKNEGVLEDQLDKAKDCIQALQDQNKQLRDKLQKLDPNGTMPPIYNIPPFLTYPPRKRRKVVKDQD